MGKVVEYMRILKNIKRCAVFIAVAVFICALLPGCATQQPTENARQDSQSQSAKTEQSASKSASDGDNLATPSNSGKLRTEGAQLVSQDGTPVQLRGVSTHGLAWFPDYVNQDLFTELRTDWGANVVRLAMYTAESEGYCTDGDKKALMELVDDGVQYATKADMYVIVDWHVLSDQNPMTNKEYAIDFFDEVSQKYADNDSVLYEICNEPNGSTTWADVKSYAEEVIPVIRANDPDSLVIVGTPTWSQDVDKAAADPLDFENVMYTLHFYAATHKDDLRNKMRTAIEGGLPVFVSEFGICNASGNGQIDYESANAWVELMDSLNVSYVCWNLSNKNEASALIAADCAKVSGFTEEDLSDEGSWLTGVLESPGFDSKTSKRKQADAATKTTSEGGDAKGVGWQAAKVNTWEADGKTFVQYDVTVANNGTQGVDSWDISIDFSEAPSLSDSWNGKFSLDGSSVRIANVDYNGSIDAGGKASDIGFIVSGSSSLALAE